MCFGKMFKKNKYKGMRMKKAFFVFIVLSALVFSVNQVFSLLSCSLITDGSCDDTLNTVFKMNYTDNALAGNASSSYRYEVCCSSDIQQGQTCNADYSNEVIRLSATDNAHAQQKQIATYSERICFGDVNCTYAADCSTLIPNEYVCLASIESEDNAHVGDCNVYLPTAGYTDGKNICCRDNCVPTGSIATCSQDIDCCLYGDAISPAYCTNKDLNGDTTASSQWHCCSEGDYWTSEGCEQAIECYPDPCESLVTQAGYWTNVTCFEPNLPAQPTKSCCQVNWFGKLTYNYDDIYVYP